MSHRIVFVLERWMLAFFVKSNIGTHSKKALLEVLK